MRRRLLAATATIILATPAFSAEDVKLPAEVTPALRAACESDVRRLCIGENPTFEKVKSCVEQKFSKLNMRCRIALASAGLGR